jgi:hypothetical protein
MFWTRIETRVSFLSAFTSKDLFFVQISTSARACLPECFAAREDEWREMEKRPRSDRTRPLKRIYRTNPNPTEISFIRSAPDAPGIPNGFP